ncbi:MAG: SRPBCC domain-containing protein [Deltaproteobacteria bacterium]|nr:SRPBCC domain-containing protein [Deltaproteobacteria bacterium]
MSSPKRAARAVADLSAGTILAVVEIESPIERVFQAITTAEVAQWWGSPEVYQVTEWKADLRPGGEWLSVGKNASGEAFSVGGKVLEVDPPRLFVHTWKPAWENGHETTVRFSLEKVANGTRVTVRHEGFAGRPESCQGHSEGWERVLAWLGKHFLPAQPAEKPLKYVVFYESAPDFMTKVRALFPAHKARLDAFHARGELLWVGTFENPAEGSMAVFSSREAAEAFVRDDPFVTGGVVSRWTIRGWRESLA